mmetsp:Transcript_19323/g.41035  ORF Transcript_19323/g.41035 Transcript_19323/m.41035 type:complete len:346 (-) Transcript_19323:1498-2535(-)
MRLRQDVRGVIRDEVVLEVVVVALNARCKSRGLQALQEPVLFWSLHQSCLEGVHMEEEPSVAVSGTILVRLVVARKEAPPVREAHVEQRQVVSEAGGLGSGEVAGARDRHGPMLLTSPRLVRLEEAGRAEVVRALLAPEDGIWDTALAALHLDEATVLPKEVVLLAIVEMLAEALDHWVNRLHPVRGQVDVEARVVPDHSLPLGCQRVAEREHGVPVVRWLVPNAKLCSHVLDHLRADQGLLHVIRIPTAPQEDPHGAQTLDTVVDGLRIQHIRPSGALAREAQLIELHVEILSVLQARFHEEVFLHSLAMVSTRSLFLGDALWCCRLGVEGQVRLDPFGNLSQS